MSIFKDTFRRYVRDQLSLREEIIDIGNTNDQGVRHNRNTGKKDIKLQSGTVVKDLAPGAFYNYTLNKQCIIRATSMVDYVENVNLEVGGLEGEQSFNALRGAALSQNFILEGGVLSDFARVRNGQRVVRRVTTPRDSFPRPGQKTNLGYGDLAIGADASSDGYGIVPMPGIIDVNVRTKSAYGSLREAKINFECHNRRQLEILEMLYMRPGYMVLLEWGWTPYINNNGQLYSEKRLLEDLFTDKDGKNSRIYTNNITQQELFSGINKLKEFHCGNYDGFLGTVKNFGFKAREDGGYSCYTELISMGEVLESLRIPSLAITDTNGSTIIGPDSDQELADKSNVTIEDETPEDGGLVVKGKYGQSQIDQSSFNEALEAGIFPRYNGLLGLVKSISNYCAFGSERETNPIYDAYENQQLGNVFQFTDPDSEEGNLLNDEGKLDINKIKDFTETYATVEKLKKNSKYGTGTASTGEYLKDLVKFQAASLKEYLTKVLQIPYNDNLDNYIIPYKGREEIKGSRFVGGSYSTQPYIRWDALCILINENLIPKDAKALHPLNLVTDRIYDEGEGYSKLDPLLYTPITDYTTAPTNELLDFSCDANICILPLQLNSPTDSDTPATPGNTMGSRFSGMLSDTYKIKDSLGYRPDTSVFPSAYTVGVYNKGLPLRYDGIEVVMGQDEFGPPNPNPVLLTKTDELRRIGSIFLNVNMLNDIAEKNAGEEGYTVGKFINDIWAEVNKACPNHNFVLTDDKESNTVFIIDLPVDNSKIAPELHTFIPFSNKNILREFEYTSNVPKAMSATIAIQSQDPRSIQDIDGVTFAAFNRSIKNRVLSKDANSNFDTTKQSINDHKQSLLSKQTELKKQIRRYQLRFFSNLKLAANEQDPEVEGNIKGILKEYQKNAAYLMTSLTDTSTFNSVIPLEFNATLDGIAGIVIGNMFKIQKDRLPKAYGKSNIGFIVFNEDQKISGQDWTTSIGGKMTLLPTEGKKPIISGIMSTAPTDNPILNQRTTTYGKGDQTLNQGQDEPTDIDKAIDGDEVYLKKLKDNSTKTLAIPGPLNDVDIPDDLPYTYEGKTVKPSHAFTTVRSTPSIDNGIRGFNNVIGMFNSWDDGGELLGTIKADGIRKVEFENGKVRILPDAYEEYFDKAELGDNFKKTILFTPKENEKGSLTTVIEGVEYYFTDAVEVFGEKLEVGIKNVLTQQMLANSDFTPTNKTQQTQQIASDIPIRVSDTDNVASTWYNIQFNPNADDRFHNGWSRDGSTISVNDATVGLGRGPSGNSNYRPLPLSEYSKNNDCWMRFDTLASTADAAVAAFEPIEINPEFPETNDESRGDVLIETYRGFDIYETPTLNYYTIPEVVIDGDVFVGEDDLDYSIENVKEYIDESLE